MCVKKITLAIYAYADETIFTINEQNKSEGIGCGILICKEEINESIIKDAMELLINDGEIDLQREKETIENGFFHASRDSPNAHSHLCNIINKKVKGIFDFTFFSVDSKSLKEKKKKERIFEKCLSSSSIEFFNSLEEVILVIEGRPDLKQQHTEDWKAKIYDLLEGASYHAPSFKTYFPKITVQIGNKNTPGLQVTDFILWCLTRANKTPKNIEWFKRIRFLTWHESKDKNEQNRSKYYLNEKPILLNWNYPFKFTESETNEELIYGYINLERFFWHLGEADFKDDNFHLFADFNALATLCKSLSQFYPQNLENIARVFIRLFDSLPLYSQIEDSDHETWRSLFHAKHVATLLIMKGFMHTGRTEDYLQRWRYEMLSIRLLEFKTIMEQ